MTNKYYLHSIQLPTGDIISQLTDTTSSPNINYLVDYAAGAVAPSFRGAHGAKPDISFSTPQVRTILNLCGYTGVDLSTGNVDLYYQAAEEHGTREAINESQHVRIRAVKAFLYWTRLSAQQDQAATVACRLVPTFDGTNPPLVPLGSQTIATDCIATQNYTLGPVYINGTEVDRVSGYELQLNPTMDEVSWSGADFLRSIVVERHNPELTVTTQDLAQWQTVGVNGMELTAMVAYLRRRQSNSAICDLNGSPVHISFYGAANPCGMATIERSKEGGTKAADLQIRCGMATEVAGTRYPLLGNYATAIT